MILVPKRIPVVTGREERFEFLAQLLDLCRFQDPNAGDIAMFVVVGDLFVAESVAFPRFFGRKTREEVRNRTTIARKINGHFQESLCCRVECRTPLACRIAGKGLNGEGRRDARPVRAPRGPAASQAGLGRPAPGGSKQAHFSRAMGRALAGAGGLAYRPTRKRRNFSEAV